MEIPCVAITWFEEQGSWMLLPRQPFVLSRSSLTSSWRSLTGLQLAPRAATISTFAKSLDFSCSCLWIHQKDLQLHSFKFSPNHFIFSETIGAEILGEGMPYASLTVSLHLRSFIHICSKQKVLFLNGSIPSGLKIIGLWFDEFTWRCCTRVAGFSVTQELVAKTRSSLSRTKPPDHCPLQVNLSPT